MLQGSDICSAEAYSQERATNKKLRILAVERMVFSLAKRPV